MLPRVLLGIDELRLLERIKAGIGTNNFILESAVSIKELWDFLERASTDLLVVTPDLLTKPVAEKIRQIRELPDAPSIIILSRTDDPKLRAEYLAVGCDAVLHSDLPPSSYLDVFYTIIEKRCTLVQQNLELERRFSEPQLGDFVSQSEAMQAFMDVVKRVAKTDTALLILGETGVGKERLARAVHHESRRKGGPFVAVNCGALPETLLESELFGHEKGSFTGATRQRRGCFESAHQGTIFLDEIGELPFHLQVKLLRVIQEREIQRVGVKRQLK